MVMNGRALNNLAIHYVPLCSLALFSWLLHVPRHRLNTYGCWTFVINVPSTWNSFLDSVHNPNTTKATFRRVLKHFCVLHRTSTLGWSMCC